MAGLDIRAFGQVDDATAAACHYFGLRIRVLTEDTVKDWAYGIIRERERKGFTEI